MGDTTMSGTVVHIHEKAADVSVEQPHIDTFIGRDPRTFTRKDAVCFARASGLRETGMSVNEIALLYDLLEEFKPRSIVELGRDFGTSSRLFYQHIVRNGGRLESWDLKIHPEIITGKAFARSWGPVTNIPTEDSHILEYGMPYYGDGYQLIFNVAHSIKSPVRDPATKLEFPISVEPFIDFLLIDTEHSTWDALGEYARWRHYLHGGALVAFHDSNLPNVRRAIDIVHELEGSRITDTWEPSHADGFGVHVLRIR